MAGITRATTFSFLLFSIFCIVSGAKTGTTDFIKTSCSATTYPALCVQSLSVYASTIQNSPRQLAQTALSVSLARARSASAFVSSLSNTKGMKSRDVAAIKDCVENMSDSVDRLSQSIRELGQISQAGGASFKWHVSNVQTWVSAALTDDTTCVDGIADMNGKVKAAVKGRIVNVAQVTSNALALVNRFAQKYV
ncbi:21 kDa protein-like [Tasmannia lanceolata]|uniref:21 kDa protein-like n=1 Tax=Tasmannia lanceolata TaxID=3420 RepID=UPI004063CF55